MTASDNEELLCMNLASMNRLAYLGLGYVLQPCILLDSQRVHKLVEEMLAIMACRAVVVTFVVACRDPPVMKNAVTEEGYGPTFSPDG